MKNFLCTFLIIALILSQINLNAQCGTTISNFPHNESFEGSSLWSPITDTYSTSCAANPDVLIRKSGTTVSNGTGPSSAQSGTYYVYSEASSSCSNDLYRISSPCFNLSGQSTASVSFYYHMFGTNVGSLDLLISVNSGSWTSIWQQSGSQVNAWSQATVDLSSYTGQSIQLRFDVTTGTGWSSDIAIDNITVDASGGGSGSPDLTIQSMSAPSSAVAGTAVTASCSVRNIGSATASSSTMAYYISTNSTYSGDDVLVGTDAVSSLGAGSASSESASITIPGGLSAGTYYILFRADYTSAVTESNESNNVGARSISITSAPSCSDGIQNGDETGVDCGGSCPNTCGGSGGPSLWSQNGSAIFYNTGNVGIGISNPTEILTVNGTVLAKEFKATLNYAWPDYVFLPTYPIMPLKELEAYIQKYGHLPNIPSAEEVEEKGVNLTEMNTKLLEKVEELTLHIIALEKRIKELEKQ